VPFRHLSNELTSTRTYLTCPISQFLFTFVTIQCTVVGQVGVDGPHAVNPVAVVPKNVLEPVPGPVHVMVGDHAQEQHGKRKSAISRRALVRNKTYSTSSYNSCTVLGPFLHSLCGIFAFSPSQSESLWPVVWRTLTANWTNLSRRCSHSTIVDLLHVLSGNF